MVYDMFGKPFPLENMQACVGPGWAPIVEQLYILCEQYNVVVYQVKEKFGGLRFYVGEAPIVVHDAISEVEKQSEKICEQCGKNGKIVSNRGWLSCVCSDHEKKYKL